MVASNIPNWIKYEVVGLNPCYFKLKSLIVQIRSSRAYECKLSGNNYFPKLGIIWRSKVKLSGISSLVECTRLRLSDVCDLRISVNYKILEIFRKSWSFGNLQALNWLKGKFQHQKAVDEISEMLKKNLEVPLFVSLQDIAGFKGFFTNSWAENFQWKAASFHEKN